MANHTGNGTFQKGDDKRRNKAGQRNKAAVAFSRTLRELIVTEGEAKLDVEGKKRKKVELLVRQLWNKALNGEPWAVQFIAERVEGKVPNREELTGKDGGPIEHVELTDDERLSGIAELLDAARARALRQASEEA